MRTRAIVDQSRSATGGVSGPVRAELAGGGSVALSGLGHPGAHGALPGLVLGHVLVLFGRDPRSPAGTSGTVRLARSRGAEPLVLVTVPAWVGSRLGVRQARLPAPTVDRAADIPTPERSCLLAVAGGVDGGQGQAARPADIGREPTCIGDEARSRGLARATGKARPAPGGRCPGHACGAGSGYFLHLMMKGAGTFPAHHSGCRADLNRPIVSRAANWDNSGGA